MVISHNQAHLIERCLDSILAQKIHEPWEVVISDDASTDDTWQVIQDYVSRYAEESRFGANEYYIPQFTCSQINSSDYNPTVTSDRCAVNKANVYMHARGKYCVNIDADDYLLGDDIYQYQIDQLESHPDCSMAVQNIFCVREGEPVSTGGCWHYEKTWGENEILTLDDYCRRRLFISNPAFMMRRDPYLNPMQMYGLLFDDPIISMHHIYQGKIICSQKAQYVYVQYGNSIWNETLKTDDSKIRMLTPLFVYLMFFPDKTKAVLDLEHWPWISNLRAILKKDSLNITEPTLLYIKRLNSEFLSKIIKNPQDEHVRVRVALAIVLFISKFGSNYPLVNRLFLALIK